VRGEVRARCVRVRDPRPSSWEPAVVVAASKSFSIIKDRWGRRTIAWRNADWKKGDEFEVADFEREYGGEVHPDRVGPPTRLRHLGVATELDPSGAPMCPVPPESPVGIGDHFVQTEHEVPAVIARLLDLGFVVRNASIDQAIAHGADNAAYVLLEMYGYGAVDGLVKGIVSYDHRFLNDTEDPAADFAVLAAHPQVRARTTAIEDDNIAFELSVRDKTSSHAIGLDEEFLEKLRALFNRALQAIGAARRIYNLYSGADFYTFLACDPQVAEELTSVGVELCGD
jgi:hypothetical protein